MTAAALDPVDGRRLRGARTRQAILDHAARLASAEGLESVSLQRLADDLGISKSGLFAHFGSKTELQLAMVETASEIFVAEVLRPGLKPPRGIARVRALCDAFLSYVARDVFPGGCFFQAAAAEFDGKPGPVRDAILQRTRYWEGSLVRAVREAQEAGEIKRDVEPEQLGWELHALVGAANDAYAGGEHKAGFKRARCAIADRLAAAAV